jgi:16S rRNA U1498 N3-methylase RsmE
MNLILVEQNECQPETDGSLIVRLPAKDRRSVHVRTILKLAARDTAKVGVIGGNMYNAEVILDADTSYRLILRETNVRPYSSSVDEDISLILAFPRPKGLNRMFAVFSQQGLKSIRVCNASRVEKSYWGACLL